MLESRIEARFPEWKATSSVESGYLVIEQGGQEIEYVPECSDQANSEFIIWGLDRLEELKYIPRLSPGYDMRGEEVSMVYEIGLGLTYHGQHIVGSVLGKTRAEAVANALARALEVE